MNFMLKTKRLISPTGDLITLTQDPEIALCALIQPTGDGVLSWESQVVQYDETGLNGLGYLAGDIEGSDTPVDCLLYRDEHGALIGILNFYSVDYPPLEQAGNFLVLVHPDRRREGIGTYLLSEMDRRWGPINWGQQKYSAGGVALIADYLLGQGHTEVS